MSKIQHRYDFILIFDVKDGNPNGDPDAGNLPRIDPETGHGIVTDVCLKRKVRNYVQLKKECKKPFDIYIKEKAVLGRAHCETFQNLGIDLGKEQQINIPQELREKVSELQLPDGISYEIDEDENQFWLSCQAGTDSKEINDWIKEENLPSEIKKLFKQLMKISKTRRPEPEEVEKGRKKMCEDYYDIRTFGAVLSLKTAPNCGQVRGPVQMTFARSVCPIVSLEHSITRMAVATEKEAAKQHGDNRTMGRKYTIPYGLFVSYGFISANLASQTEFSEEDLELFWEALKNMFEHDRSASRGLMSLRKLIVFKHESALGNANVQELFDRVTIRRRDVNKPPRDFLDYEVLINKEGSPEKITIFEL